MNEISTASTTTAVDDPILEILLFLSKSWGKPLAPAGITAGLPLSEGRLTVKLIDQALERIGVASSRTHRVLETLPDFEFPVIFTDKNGQMLLALGRPEPGKLTCFDPIAGQPVEVGPSRVDTEAKRPVILVKPIYKTSDVHKEEKPGSAGWIRQALRGNTKSILLLLLASTFVNTFAVAFPLFTLNVYDRVLPNSAFATLWVLAIGILTVLAFDLVLKTARSAIIDYVGRKIDLRLSSVLFDKVMNVSLAARPRSTGAFVNRIAQYEVLRDFFTANTLVTFVDFLFLGIFAYVISLLVGWLVIFPLLAGLIAIIATIIIWLRSAKVVSAALVESSVRNGILVEALSAIQTIKTARAEGAFLQKWETTILATSETQTKIRSYQALAQQITTTSAQMSLVAIVIGGSYMFSGNHISMGAIIATMMLSNRIIAPINSIAVSLLRTRGAIEGYRTIKSILELKDERDAPASYVGRSIEKGAVEFNKVRFAYPGSNVPVLDGVSFSIKPGEKVGIIGRIGSGKTTLGRLLVNFYEPLEGEILVDGVDINQYHPSELRKNVGLVLQEPELFNGTIRENVVLSEPTASDERVLDVCRRCGVDDFVSRHPMGYSMMVGERGSLLSGGQRQTVALARAMLVDPKVLFLDEPSSSMDLATERELIGHLATSLAPEHTVLIATHRHSLLSLVTRLIVIDHGHIIADGPRDAVLERLRAGGQPT